VARWQRGEAEVEQLVGRGELELVTGSQADGTALLAQARRTATSAAGLVESDTHRAYVLAYDAARFACNALLAQQGLRATTNGGHYAVEREIDLAFAGASSEKPAVSAESTSRYIARLASYGRRPTTLSRCSRRRSSSSSASARSPASWGPTRPSSAIAVS
jgi:hypothetical protein